MDNLFDTIADVGSDEEEDEDFEGEGAAPKPKKTNGTNGIDDSSEEEDDDDEDRLRQASFGIVSRLYGYTDWRTGRRGLHRRRGRRR
jgi:transcription elongation factor SPT6